LIGRFDGELISTTGDKALLKMIYPVNGQRQFGVGLGFCGAVVRHGTAGPLGDSAIHFDGRSASIITTRIGITANLS
jgi:hypothetical protein